MPLARGVRPTPTSTAFARSPRDIAHALRLHQRLASEGHMDLRRIGSGLVVGFVMALGAVSTSQALTIFVDQTQSFRYVNATAATTQVVPADWFTFNFDDSGWFVGNEPFSSGATSG